MADDRYEERYCAFIDILGFSQLVSELRNDPSKFSEVQQLLVKIHEPTRFQVSTSKTDKSDLQAQSISDAVAISTNANAVGLISLFLSVDRLVISLLREGYFTRGAVCRGKLYHDNKTVFGDALIKAYTLESQIVRYPRIMITKDVVEDLNRFGTPMLSKSIIQSEDGPYFLHVLQPLQAHLENLKKAPTISGENEPDLHIYEEMRARIVQRFAESVDTPRHFEKVQWFARYWNKSNNNIRETVGRISGPGLDREPAVWG